MEKKFKISASKAKCYKECKRKYFFRYVEELENATPVQALQDGKSYHEKIESLYKEGWFSIDETDPKVTAMALAYEKYIYPHFKVQKVEEEFEYPLGEKHLLVGRYDARAEDGCLVEHKTTSKKVDDEYLFNLQFDEQIPTYMLASGARQIYYTICQKPSIRQKKDESDEEFLKRCVDWYDEDTDSKIRVVKLTRTDEEVKQREAELSYLCLSMELDERWHKLYDKNGEFGKEKIFYRNTCACTQFGRSCPYMSICLNYKPELQYVEFVKREKK